MATPEPMGSLLHRHMLNPSQVGAADAANRTTERLPLPLGPLRLGVLYAVPFDPIRLAVLGDPVQIVDDVASSASHLGAALATAASGTLVYASGRAGLPSSPQLVT